MAYFVSMEDLYLHSFVVNETYDNESAAYLRAKMLAANARQRAQAEHHKYYVHFSTSAPSLHAQDTSYNNVVSAAFTLSWRDLGSVLHVEELGSESAWYTRKEMLRAALTQGQIESLTWTCPTQADNVSGYLCQ